MPCPVCSQRKAKRACPALGRDICTVCCATKRLSEIACPPDCRHLVSALANPSAAVKRRQDADVAALLPSIRELTERQYQLFFLFQGVVARTKPEGLSRVVDADVVDASGAVAATLETAARGVIYEQQPHSPTARRMAEGFRALLVEAREQGATVFDREAAVSLRAIEAGAKTVAARIGAGETGYLDLMGRLLHVDRTTTESAPEPFPQSGIILP
jgi:hypothetical protein